MDRPGELGVTGLIHRDDPHGVPDLRVGGEVGLMGGFEGSPGLPHATFDRVLDREGLERSWRARAIARGHRMRAA